MAGELNIKLRTTGLTVYALILGHDRTTRWNGANMVAINTVTDANWTVGMVAMAEQVTSDATATATYVGTFPAGISTAGEYIAEFYTGASPSPGDQAVGVQEIQWTGSKMTSVGELYGRTVSSTAADNLELLCTTGLVVGAVNDGAPGDTAFVTDLVEASNDHYNGCVLVWTSGNLQAQTRRVSDYVGLTKTITLESALTEAPANGDDFIILGRIED